MNRITSIILFVTLFIASCGGKEEPKQSDADSTKPASAAADSNMVELSATQSSTAGIATGNAVQREMATALRVNGRIDVPPQNMVSISFPLGGYLKSTQLLPGMHVGKGQSIAVMEDERYIQLQQDYLTVKARQVFLEKELRRQQELNAGKATSDKVLQQTEADYNSGEVQLSALVQKLALIGVDASSLAAGNISRAVPIRSPITGFVSKVNVNIGKYVNPPDVLFEIVNPADIHLALTVFEKDIPPMAIGQEVTAYTTGNPGKKYICKIILIGRDISPDRSTEVHCHFEKYDKELIPGTFMNAEVATSPRKVWALPEDAVVNSGGRSYVFRRVQGNRFEMMAVRTGDRDQGFVEISPADSAAFGSVEIVTKGAYTLLMKLKNMEEE